MDEATWLACTEPDRTLDFLRARGQLSERKGRLFAVACCRRIWHLLSDESSRGAVEMAEEHADGRLSVEELSAAERGSAVASYGYYVGDFRSDVALLRCGTAAAATAAWPPGERRLDEVSLEAARWAATTASEAAFLARKGVVADWPSLKNEMEATRAEEGRVHLRLLRDIFNPFLRSLSPLVLTWNDGLVVRLAEAAYRERNLPAGTLENARLAVLADALAEAGCLDAGLLGHLRGPGPHFRGCWAVDNCLGRV